VRGKPRCLAHRPLPSMTIATCVGTRSRGIAGGRAPEACGDGGRTVLRRGLTFLGSLSLDQTQ
jgi:hypothetical protein